MESVVKTMDKKLAFKWIFTILLSLSIFLIPTDDIFTPTLRLYMVVTVFVIVVLAFELLPILIASLLLPALYVVLQIVPFSVAYSPWTQSTVSMVLGGFLIANICDECGVLQRMAFWIVRKCNASFTIVVLGLFFANLLICIVTFGNGIVIGIVFCYAICKALNLEKTPEGVIIMSTSVLGGALCNHMIYNPLAMGIALPVAQMVIPDLAITPFDLLIAFWPLIPFCVITIMVYKKMYKLPKKHVLNGGKEYFQTEAEKLGKITVKEKKAIVLLAFVMIYMFSQPFHGLGIEYAFMLAPLIAFFPGVNLGTTKTLQSLPFEMLFFVAACAGIGTVGMSIGLDGLVSAVFVPIVAEFSNIGFLFGVIILCVAANFLMTPIAMYAALPAALITAATVAGIAVEPTSILYTVFLGGDFLFLPYQYANYLIMFSFGVMTMKDFVVTQTVKVFLLILFILVCIYPYWSLIGIL